MRNLGTRFTLALNIYLHLRVLGGFPELIVLRPGPHLRFLHAALPPLRPSVLGLPHLLHQLEDRQSFDGTCAAAAGDARDFQRKRQERVAVRVRDACRHVAAAATVPRSVQVGAEGVRRFHGCPAQAACAARLGGVCPPLGGPADPRGEAREGQKRGPGPRRRGAG
eukprot:SAG31_NODE_930_length_10920_cov_4.478329_12_plen_166_part_00